MIKFFDSISELTFPIATMKKTNDLKESATYFFYNGQAILKRENLLDTFNINEHFLPKTYTYFYKPEMLFAEPKLLKNNLIIDSKLNIFLPIKKIKLQYISSIVTRKEQNYIQIPEVPHFLPIVFEKSATYPLICIVENTYFLVGWTDKKVTPYETFI